MNTPHPQQPIGIFDSGIGGLTVVKEIIRLLPNESLIYFGDTARVPYGTKSDSTIKEYSVQDTKFLLTHNVKLIVVACNSASSVALDEIKSRTDKPVVGVIKPGAEAAVIASHHKRIAIIGTNATVSSRAYEHEIHKFNSEIDVAGKACPLFVPIVEEGWMDHEIAFLTAKEYLFSLKKFAYDTMILGCTHYPLLKNVIRKVVGENVTLIDSGIETAKQVKNILTEMNLLNPSNQKPNRKYFVSDLPHKFKEIGEMFLGEKIERITKIDL
ncbi:MAG: glutamate racemase [Bacteroidetes bacterium]|nr:glutamate racemase [Bacteroidota bacterium]MBU2583773.1 glutamate racemase [Bacteroidota bacterium]